MADKPHLNLIVTGHVDHGKSTSMGHFLFDLGAVDDRTIEEYAKESEKTGAGDSFKYAWVLDQLKGERGRIEPPEDGRLQHGQDQSHPDLRLDRREPRKAEHQHALVQGPDTPAGPRRVHRASKADRKAPPRSDPGRLHHHGGGHGPG